MPRIDPSQLLSTLSVLLAKDGGIRSSEEVPRIVQLMQKFSKKLVSKCIYIHILRSSSSELLETFLNQKGWDLLNLWFSDAMKNQNYYLCGELVRLFSVCPMNSTRLKENVDVNQAPKLIRQLSCDTRIAQDIRAEALQVLQQWMSVIRTPPNLLVSNTKQADKTPSASPGSGSPTVKTNGASSANTGESLPAIPSSVLPPSKPVPGPPLNQNKTSPENAKSSIQEKAGLLPSSAQKLSTNLKEQIKTVSDEGKSKVGSPGYQSPGRKKVSPSKKSARSNVIVDSSDESEDDSTKSDKKPILSKVKLVKSSNSKDEASQDDTTDVDDLLGGDSTSEDDIGREANKQTSKENTVDAKENNTKKDTLSADELAAKKKEEKEQREKEREERRRREREKEKKRAQDRRDKAKPYSRTELRGSLDSSQKDRIKEVAKKMKEESTKFKDSSSSFGRIPKIPKKESPPEATNKKPSGPSFADMLGEIDTKKPKVKGPPIKNKNKDLLESISNPSPNKSSKTKSPSSSSKTSASDIVKAIKVERRNSLLDNHNSSSDTEKPKSKTPEKTNEKNIVRTEVKDEKSEDVEKKEKSSKSEKLPEDRPKPALSIPEKVAEKRPSKDISSPKIEVKKSPSVIKESSFFGDVLGDIMKEQPRKKKRRLSDAKEVKAEKDLKSEKEVKPEKDVKVEKEDMDISDRAEQAKKEADKQLKDLEKRSSSPEEEKMEDGDDLPFAEPTSELPREVRGILVYARGSKTKKRIQWRPDDKLVEIEYFEMNEDERANVFKIKSFEEMRKKEMIYEKSHKGGGMMMDEDMDDAEAGGDSYGGHLPSVRNWSLDSLEFDGEIQETLEKMWKDQGKDSLERELQEKRELGVLKALFFNIVPSDPSEPDSVDPTDSREAVEISPVDLSENRDESTNDYSSEDWPGLAVATPISADPTANLNSLNALLKDLKPGLLSSLNLLGNSVQIPPLAQPPPALNPAEAQLFQAQKAAAETMKLGTSPTPHPPPNGHYPHNYHPPPTDNRTQPPPNTIYSERGNQRNFGNNRQGGNYNKSGNYNNGGGHHRRESGGGGRDYNRGRDYKRPCKFWMERGRCKDEDRCMFPHPSR